MPTTRYAAVAATLLAATAAHSEENNPMSPDQSAVLAVVQQMTEDLEQGSLDGIMTAYEDEAAIMFEPGTPTTDVTAIRDAFAQLIAVDPKVTYAGHEVYVAGDVAVHLAPWSMTGTAPDGTAVAQGGLSVAVMRRQPDGSWRMVIDNPFGGRLLQQ